eukprot:Phypoly_transcript_10282.p1 GENE.Phypoly_transcript_10282~~Phypoly_transcript_10282.p1  ORF type:complete len:345 (+),score=44.84 Phypoly_transcript_10282:199-1233(+)
MAKVELVKKVMDEVYGKCLDPRNWVPKKYKDTKSRYLWTDAFGVCNYITLFCETKDQTYIQQADALIQDVHDTLGKDRALKNRLGRSTDDRPLLGGLRIGKEDPEGEPDGDGQYFHYLTKWMFALSRMSLVKKEAKYNDWAIDLAKVAHDKFIRGSSTNSPRMFWKMSIDLSYPHVDSEGNLDPFDGYVTYRALQELASDPNALKSQINTFEKMVTAKYPRYRSSDPLDLGEALWITHFYPEEEWAKHVSAVSLASLEILHSRGYFLMPENRRLAFREFGTTIGVQVHKNAGPQWHKRIEELHDFWAPKIFKRDHDITPVMYCTSLLPGSFWAEYPNLRRPSAP